MANTGRSRSAGTSSRSTKSSSSGRSARTTGQRSSSQRTSSRSGSAQRSTSRRTSAPAPQESGAESLFKKFASSRAALPLIFIGAVLLIVGIDLLVSWNKYEVFFKILGVEILIAVVVWGVLTLVFSSRKKNDTDGMSEDEV